VDAIRHPFEDVDVGIVVVSAAFRVSIHLVDFYT